MATILNVSLKKSCTATIISPVWVVTSFSCINTGSLDYQEWVVLAGITDSDPLADDTTQIRIVREIVPHPMARLGQHLTSPDLALVQLDEPLSLGGEVGAICLGSSQITKDQVCVSAGWTPLETGVCLFGISQGC